MLAEHPSEPLQAIIFDVGGVLYENIQEFFLPDLARRHGMDPDYLLSLGYRHGGDWGLGRATEEEYWRGILNDALAIYFLDTAPANAFVARWCLGYRVETVSFRLSEDARYRERIEELATRLRAHVPPDRD